MCPNIKIQHYILFSYCLLITYSAFFKNLKKKKTIGIQWAVHQPFIGIKKACDSTRKEALYNILTVIGIPMKLVRLIKMSLNETYSRVWVGKNLFDMFPFRNGLKQGDALSPLLINLALDYAIKRVQVIQDGLKLNGTHLLLVYADDINIYWEEVYIL